MTNENETPSMRSPLYGLLAIPVTIAIMLAMMVAATWNVVDYEASEWNTLLMLTTVLMAGAMLGKAPRIIFEPVGTRPSLVSLGFAAVIFSVAIYCVQIGVALFGLVLAVSAIGVHLFDRARRHEEEIILVGIVAGFAYAIQVAATGHTWTVDGEYMGQYYDILDVDRAVTGYLFFTWWMVSVLTSALIALAMRGRLQDAGRGAWFKDMPARLDASHASLFAGLFVWIAAHAFSLWHLTTLDNPDAVFLGSHIGFFWAFFTGLIAMFVAFCWSEHWRTLGGLVGVNWLLYSLGSWQDAGLFGLDGIEFLNGSLGALSWFAIFFWVNAAVLWAGFTGRLVGGVERRDAGQARQWWGRHWYGITVFAALATALVVRVIWNVIPAMNAQGTGEWDMTGGSDPWYMKRAIDYILAQNSHFIIDMDRSYPVGSINPRPPLFSWTLALGGELLNPFLDGDVHAAAWWSVAGMPAIYGALTVLPVAATCKRFFGTGAGAIGAWLIALMPGHVSHSTFALADHDAFVILFMSLGFYFWLRAAEAAGSDRLLETSDWNPMQMVKGVQAAFSQRAPAMAYALLAGVSFATVALGWKGFVYGLAIIYAAYFVQTALNLLRRRDSMPLTAAALVMMTTAFLLPLPFYGNMELDLIWDASGFQPMFYILGFTVINGWVVTSFRDKPWLMVIIMGGGISTVLLGTLYLLQVMDISNGWDVLTTGGYYFSKNKIFGTIAEAQAPSRGQLFANFGPIVFILALGTGSLALLRGIRQRDQPALILSVWILIAAYMAWSAGRFMFNATPPMAIMGAAAIVGCWRWAGTKEFVRTWRRLGISSSGSRFRATLTATRRHPGVPAIGMVLLLLFSQHAIYGIDSGIPRGEVAEKQIDATIYDLMPDVLRADLLGWSVFDASPYTGYGFDDEETPTCQGECWYMGTFGPGFNGRSWNEAYDWLESQDQTFDVSSEEECLAVHGSWSDLTCHQSFSQRPAFVSWWDYGFQALAQGQHPTVADNFQSGIPAAGNMLLSGGEEDTLALFIVTLAEGDMRTEVNDDPDDDDGERYTPAFANVMKNHMSDASWEEWVIVTHMKTPQAAIDHSFTVTGTADDVILAEGHLLDAEGVPESNLTYRLYEDGDLIGEYMNEYEAITAFDQNSKVDWEDEGFSSKATHYIIGDYWYTDDLIEQYDDVSTSLHRQNARLAVARTMLTTVFSMEELVDLYNDLTGLEYEVANYEGGPGETIVRNNDIRYFAVDNRLYPIGGYQYAESGMHYGNPTGIFYAPTTLSGLDPDTYINSVYITQRGDRAEQEMTSQQFEDAYVADILAQNSGTGGDVIELVDVRVDQQPEFFETMIARTYIGYGSPQLGLDSISRIAQPAQHFSGYGTIDTPLTYARPLPGAMMSHFVLANWYEPGNEEGLGGANSGVKVLKYYSGATLEGDVVLGDAGAIPNAKILVERDAFSGEDSEDLDARTYWVPIMSTQADDEGHFSLRVPSGRIRVTAFMGASDLDAARDTLKTGGSQGAQGWFMDLVTDGNEDRTVNPITGILANVSGSTWLGETSIQIDGAAGHSNGETVLDISIDVEASGASGTVFWEGEGDFDDQPLADVELRISNIWSETRSEAYYVTTSSGEVEGEREYGPSATGEVTFTGPGVMISEGVVTATDFTGTYTRAILHEHTFTGDGDIDGRGTLIGVVYGTGAQMCNDGEMADGVAHCLIDDGTYLIDGYVQNVSGRFTSNGSSSFISEMVRETIIGAGAFYVDASDENLSSYGTINGTGVFQGTGRYSGDMVSPGSFHLVDAIPGTYHVAVIFDNGEETVLSMPLLVELTPSKDNELILMGTWISGNAETIDGEVVTGQLEIVNADASDEGATGPCGDIAWAPCWFETDDAGSFGVGPVLEGRYFLSMDADQDGFDEYRSALITVKPDEAGNVSADNIDRIVPMFDIEFLVLDPDSNPVEGQNITFGNTFTPMQILARDNGNGSYNVELPMGEWVLESAFDEAHILYEEIVIDDEDITGLVLQYVESTWVNGTVMYANEAKEDSELSPYNNQPVVIQWGGIQEQTLTNEDGEYSFQLPSGIEVNMTVHVVVGNLLGGQHFTVGVDEVVSPLLPVPAVGASGDLFLYREGNPYTQHVPGYEFHPFMVETQSEETGLTFQWPVNPANGRFTTYVLDGEDGAGENWTLSVNDPDFNVEPYVHHAIGDNASLMLIAEPDLVQVTIVSFIDHDLEGNASNGTALPLDFRIFPASSFEDSMIQNFTADDIGWENGSITLQLEVGSWSFETEAKDPRDAANATPYNTRLANSNGQIPVPIGGDEMDVEFGFIPEWRTDATLTNEVGAPLENWSVFFEEIDDDRQFFKITDANGTIVDYLPEGEWLVIVNAFIQDDGNDTNDDPLQEYRGRLVVDENTPDASIVWQTLETAQFNLTLIEDGSGTPMVGYSVTASSTEFGEVMIGPSDENGVIDGGLMEGTWMLSMNRTDNNLRWVLDNTSLTVTAGNDNPAMNLTPSKWVEIAGNLFWDLNADGNWNVAEGVSDANVTVTGTAFGPVNLTTDALGTWRVFVPVTNNYSVVANKEGYAEGMTTIAVDYAVNTSDIEMLPGMVTVGGLISHVLPSQWALISDGIEIVLLPESGLERASVTPTKVLDNGTWNGTWTAEVDPGHWIIHTTYDGDEGRFAAMAYLDASVAEGGSLDLMLSTASILNIGTEWNDFDGVAHTLADDAMITSGTDLILSKGLTMRWNATVDTAGEITILLPAGDYSISGTFITEERNMSMTYNGGREAEVVGGGVESPDYTVTFRVNEDHSVSFGLGENHTNITQSDGDSDEFTIILSEDEFEFLTAELNMNLAYEGNRAQDEYVMTIVLNGGDAEFWTIEIHDGTDDDGEDIWAISRNYSLGIDAGASDDIRLRIRAPNASVAQSYDTGHSLKVRMTHSDQSFSEYQIKLFVPQVYGFALVDEDIDVFGITPGNDETLDLYIRNPGNGDDEYYFDISDLPTQANESGWQVIGPSMVPVGPGAVQPYSLTIHAPADSPDMEFSVYITVRSEDNTTYPAIEVPIKTALPDLEITKFGVIGQSKSGFAAFDAINEFYVEVHNSGGVHANDVTVQVLNESGAVVGTATDVISSGETTSFPISVDTGPYPIGSHNFVLHIVTEDLQLASNPDDMTFKVNIQKKAPDEANNWLGLVVLAMFVGLLVLVWKFTGRRGAQPF